MLYKVPLLEYDWVEIYVNADNLFHKFRRARHSIFYSFWVTLPSSPVLFEEDGLEISELPLQCTNNTRPVLRRVVKYGLPTEAAGRGRLLTGIDLHKLNRNVFYFEHYLPFPHVDEQITQVYILNLLEDKLVLTFGGATTQCSSEKCWLLPWNGGIRM